MTILNTIINEVNILWDTTMVGAARGLTEAEKEAQLREYQQRRITIIRKHGYTDKTFRRAILSACGQTEHT